MRFGVAMSDNQIADVRNPSESVGEDKNGIAPVKSIGEQQERADQAQPPKAGGNDHFFLFLGGIPLHEKAGKENDVPEPAEDFPKAPLNAEKFVVMKN